MLRKEATDKGKVMQSRSCGIACGWVPQLYLPGMYLSPPPAPAPPLPSLSLSVTVSILHALFRFSPFLSNSLPPHPLSLYVFLSLFLSVLSPTLLSVALLAHILNR